MKWLLAQISKGRDVSGMFSSVVKIVSTKSVELKKMVYMFLVHYVDANKECRELALLAINSYQKDLADRNQLVRALALRVLTSFRVPEICQIQLLAMRKCAIDRSPFVRKTAAHSVPKLYVFFLFFLFLSYPNSSHQNPTSLQGTSPEKALKKILRKFLPHYLEITKQWYSEVLWLHM